MQASDPIQELFGLSARDLVERGRFEIRDGELERLPAFLRAPCLGDLEVLSRDYRGPLEVAHGDRVRGLQTPITGVPPRALLELGLTVYFKDALSILPEARSYLHSIEQALGLPSCAGMGLFANARGSGLPIHHDASDQWLIHLLGHKRFRAAPNRVRWPALPHAPHALLATEFASVYGDGLPPEAPALDALSQDFQLRPGSVVFIPAGLWHATEALDGPCLSLSIALRAPTALPLLLNFLRHSLMQSEDWRRPIYGLFSAEHGAAEAEHSRISALLDALRAQLDQLCSRDLRGAWAGKLAFEGKGYDPLSYDATSRFLRTPLAQVSILPIVGTDQITCEVRTSPSNEPPQRGELRFNAHARGLVQWIAASEHAFSALDLAERFEGYGADELVSFLIDLAAAGAIRPLLAPPLKGA